MAGEFPSCGCHYTTNDDGIHFCAMHKAAPDLLEAAKAIMDWDYLCDECCEDGDCQSDELKAAFHALSAAIAKATGKNA